MRHHNYPIHQLSAELRAKRNEYILKLHDKGLLVKEIAGIVGLTPTGVCEVLRKERKAHNGNS